MQLVFEEHSSVTCKRARKTNTATVIAQESVCFTATVISQESVCFEINQGLV